MLIADEGEGVNLWAEGHSAGSRSLGKPQNRGRKTGPRKIFTRAQKTFAIAIAKGFGDATRSPLWLT